MRCNQCNILLPDEIKHLVFDVAYCDSHCPIMIEGTICQDHTRVIQEDILLKSGQTLRLTRYAHLEMKPWEGTGDPIRTWIDDGSEYEILGEINMMEQVGTLLSLPYKDQKAWLIRSIRSWGKQKLNEAFREEVFRRDPELLRRFYSDPEIVEWLGLEEIPNDETNNIT